MAQSASYSLLTLWTSFSLFRKWCDNGLAIRKRHHASRSSVTWYNNSPLLQTNRMLCPFTLDFISLAHFYFLVWTPGEPHFWEQCRLIMPWSKIVCWCLGTLGSNDEGAQGVGYKRSFQPDFQQATSPSCPRLPWTSSHWSSVNVSLRSIHVSLEMWYTSSIWWRFLCQVRQSPARLWVIYHNVTCQKLLQGTRDLGIGRSSNFKSITRIIQLTEFMARSQTHTRCPEQL